MAPQQTPTLLSPSELSYLHTSLSLNPPIRPDARSPRSFRPLVAETDLLPSANGSARLCFADGTEAIVGVKAEVEKTTGRDNVLRVNGEDERMRGLEGKEHEEEMVEGDDNWIEVTVDMPGCRDDDAVVVFMGRMIHEGLVADGDLRERLIIHGRWHWRIFVDILLLSPPQTYPLPLLSLTTHLALLSTRLPSPISSGNEDPLFNDDWDASIPLYPSTSSLRKGKGKSSSSSEKASSRRRRSRPPITLLVICVGENIFFDPTHAELAVADAVLAVTIASPPSPSSTSAHSSSSSSSDDNADGDTEDDKGLDLLAVRTIDPPSRMSVSSSVVGEVGEGDAAVGAWKARKGGMRREVVGRMVRMCVERGGVGVEVLGGLEGFVG
ncbi:Exosome complex component rrp42 [Lecanora helva]